MSDKKESGLMLLLVGCAWAFFGCFILPAVATDLFVAAIATSDLEVMAWTEGVRLMLTAAALMVGATVLASHLVAKLDRIARGIEAIKVKSRPSGPQR